MASQVSSALPINRIALGESLAVLFCPAANGKVFGVTIDRDDLERVTKAGFWRVANFREWLGQVGLYCYTIQKRKNIYLHRFITGASRRQVVDHSNHRTLDNRKSQIVACSQSRNQLNKTSSKSPYGRGVRLLRSGRFRATVAFEGRRRYLGTFDTPEPAADRVRQFLIANGAAYAAAELGQ